MQVAIVGCGGIGAAHARAYASLPGVQVVACVDRDRERAAALAGQFGAAALTELEDLPTEVGIVSVATDPASHFAVAGLLQHRGPHDVCEKPLAMESRQALELVLLARRCGRALSVGFKMRYEPVFRQARALAPEVGAPISVATTKTQPYKPRPGRDWVPEVGAMFELSVHDFDLVHWITGLVPEAVLHADLGHRFGWPAEDRFHLTLRYSGGVVACLTGCYARGGKWTGKDFCLTVTGEEGYLRVERGERVVLHAGEVRVFDTPAGGNQFADELGEFVRAVAAGAEPPIAAMAGVTTTAMVEAARESARIGRPVSLSAVCPGIEEAGG